MNFQVFYDDLSPYGYWIDNPNYGYVWVPNVEQGFSPYRTNGHWVFTDAGWTWFSDYPWGWAPFHYGRWYSDPVYGPMWVPGNEWGPGWVTWRRSEGYYGWAPIEPGISISIAYSSGYNVPYDRWVFVRDRDFGRTNINNYYINSSRNTTIITNSTVINNIHSGRSNNVQYNSGPERGEVEKRVGKPITPIAIRESNKPGQHLGKDQLQIYRPNVQQNNASGSKAAPTKVANLKEVKPLNERKKENQPQQDGQINKEQPSQHQRSNKPMKELPSQRQHNDKPLKEQPTQRQRIDQPVKEQPMQHQHSDQPVKEKPTQHERNDQPVHRQRNEQPVKEQPMQHQRNDQPMKAQPNQRQPSYQQDKQQQRNNEPDHTQPGQQPGRHQPSQQQQHHSQPNMEDQQRSHPDKQQRPSEFQNKEEQKQPH